MADKSAIEWTDATWNPVTGCTRISRGCDYCYAERFAERWRGILGHSYEQGFDLRLWPSRLVVPSPAKASHGAGRHDSTPLGYIHNTFEHYGPGNFNMLGWDALQDPDQLSLLNFRDTDAA